MSPVPNVSQTPKVWTADELAAGVETSLNAFVDRRLAEPETKYAEHLLQRRHAFARLFLALRQIDPDNPDPATVRKIVLDNELLSALRYAAGPPISEDDLGVLVTRKPKRLTKKAMRKEETLAPEILKLICRVADSSRFPWVRSKRAPRPGELRRAIEASATLHAAQTLQTERRAYGRELERQLRERLEKMGS
jgi:XamI restriction endonuclease